MAPRKANDSAWFRYAVRGFVAAVLTAGLVALGVFLGGRFPGNDNDNRAVSERTATQTVVVVTNQATTLDYYEGGYQEEQGSTQQQSSPYDTPTGRQIQRMVKSECQPWKDRWACVRAKLTEYLWLNFSDASWVGYIENINVADSDGNGTAGADVLLDIECGLAAQRAVRPITAAVLNSGLGITAVNVFASDPEYGGYVDPNC